MLRCLCTAKKNPLHSFRFPLCCILNRRTKKVILGLKELCMDIFEFGFLIPHTYWQTMRSNRLLLNLAVGSKAHPTAIQFHERPLKRAPPSRWPTSQQQMNQSALRQTSKTYKSFKLDCKVQDFFFTCKGKPSANWLCNKPATSLVSRLFQTCPSVHSFDVTICHPSSALLCVWATLEITPFRSYNELHLYFGLYSVSITQFDGAKMN